MGYPELVEEAWGGRGLALARGGGTLPVARALLWYHRVLKLDPAEVLVILALVAIWLDIRAKESPKGAYVLGERTSTARIAAELGLGATLGAPSACRIVRRLLGSLERKRLLKRTVYRKRGRAGEARYNNYDLSPLFDRLVEEVQARTPKVHR